jgi:hypothetical protein
MAEVARWTARAAGGFAAHDHVRIEAHELGGELGRPLDVPFHVPPFHREVPPFDPPQRAQALGERVGRRGGPGEVANTGGLGGRLRPGGEGHQEDGEGERRDENGP